MWNVDYFMIFIPPWWDQSFDLCVARSKERSPNSQLRLRPSRSELWWIPVSFCGRVSGDIFGGRPLEVEFLVGGTCSNPSRQLRHDWYRIESDRGIKSWKRPMKPCMNSTRNWNVGGGIYLAQIPWLTYPWRHSPNKTICNGFAAGPSLSQRIPLHTSPPHEVL